MKRKILALVTLILLVMSFSLVGCETSDQTEKDQTNSEIHSIYELYVASAKENGEPVLSYEDWLNSIKGETPTIEIDEDGFWVINGKKTEYLAGKKVEANGTKGLVYSLVAGENGVELSVIDYIGDSAEVVIPDTFNGYKVTSIVGSDTSGFCHNDKITSIVIGNNVTSIGNYAFRGCYSLTSIVIPNSVTSIGVNVFSYCDSLTSIVIPNSVTSIGEDAFWCCDSLTIYCGATSEPSGWNSWWNSSRPVYWYSETEPTTSGNYWHYVGGEITKW